jgi:hypothetical protein
MWSGEFQGFITHELVPNMSYICHMPYTSYMLYATYSTCQQHGRPSSPLAAHSPPTTHRTFFCIQGLLPDKPPSRGPEPRGAPATSHQSPAISEITYEISRRAIAQKFRPTGPPSAYWGAAGRWAGCGRLRGPTRPLGLGMGRNGAAPHCWHCVYLDPRTQGGSWRGTFEQIGEAPDGLFVLAPPPLSPLSDPADRRCQRAMSKGPQRQLQLLGRSAPASQHHQQQQQRPWSLEVRCGLQKVHARPSAGAAAPRYSLHQYTGCLMPDALGQHVESELLWLWRWEGRDSRGRGDGRGGGCHAGLSTKGHQLCPVTRVASLLSSLPGSWSLWVRRCYMPRSLLAVGWFPPLGGLRPGITSWVARSNALIRSSLNRQLCELPTASHAAVQVKGLVASSYWGHYSAPSVDLHVKFRARYARRRRWR